MKRSLTSDHRYVSRLPRCCQASVCRGTRVSFQRCRQALDIVGTPHPSHRPIDLISHCRTVGISERRRETIHFKNRTSAASDHAIVMKGSLQAQDTTKLTLALALISRAVTTELIPTRDSWQSTGKSHRKALSRHRCRRSLRSCAGSGAGTLIRKGQAAPELR